MKAMTYAECIDPVITYPIHPDDRISVCFYDGPDDPASIAGREGKRLAEEMMALPPAEREAWLANWRRNAGLDGLEFDDA